jgi:hypothetical protein
LEHIKVPTELTDKKMFKKVQINGLGRKLNEEFK